MENIVYEHKLIIGGGAYINIEIEENRAGKLELSMQGGSPNGHSGQCSDNLKEHFNKNPEDLDISKEIFDELIEIWEEWHLETIPLRISSFLNSVKTSPENQEIEDNLDSVGKFTIKVKGQTISLDSSHDSSYRGTEGNYDTGLHRIHNVKFRIDNGRNNFFEFHDSVKNFKKDSLSRRDIFRAFECILTDAEAGNMSFQEFKDNFCEDEDEVEGIRYNEVKKRNVDSYRACKNAITKLEDVNDIEELSAAFRSGEATNYTGWIVQDTEDKNSATLKM